jgi:septum formation protein
MSRAPLSAAPILLASGSPRRRDFLASVRIPFDVVRPEVDETPLPDELPERTVRRLAEAKAEAGHLLRPRDAGLVLAADTEVVLDHRALGKPRDPAAARGMLAELSGRGHDVITGFCLLDPASGRREVGLAATRVWFRELDGDEIAGYVDTGEPLDKAGAYACQGIGAFLIARVEGSYTNVVGLPLGQVIETLRRMGGPLPFPERRNR